MGGNYQCFLELCFAGKREQITIVHNLKSHEFTENSEKIVGFLQKKTKMAKSNKAKKKAGWKKAEREKKENGKRKIKRKKLIIKN